MKIKETLPPMPTSCPRSINQMKALVARDLRDVVRNPTTLACCAFVVLACGFLRFVGEINDPATNPSVRALALLLALGMSNSVASGMMLLVVLLEEQERGMYGAVLRAGVSPVTIAVSKAVAGTLATLVVGSASYLALGCRIADLAPFALALGVGTLPCTLLMLAGGLAGRDQGRAGVFSALMVVPALAPVVGLMSATARAVTWVTPLGPAAELTVWLYCGLEPAVSLPLLALAYVAWIAVCVVAVRKALRSFRRNNERRHR